MSNDTTPASAEEPLLSEPTPPSLDELWNNVPPIPDAVLRLRIEAERNAMVAYIAAKAMRNR